LTGAATTGADSSEVTVAVLEVVGVVGVVIFVVGVVLVFGILIVVGVAIGASLIGRGRSGTGAETGLVQAVRQRARVNRLVRSMGVVYLQVSKSH
jgi:hypothetical protein